MHTEQIRTTYGIQQDAHDAEAHYSYRSSSWFFNYFLAIFIVKYLVEFNKKTAVRIKKKEFGSQMKKRKENQAEELLPNSGFNKKRPYRNLNELPAQGLVNLLWRKIDADCSLNMEIPARYDQLSKVSMVKISYFADSPLNFQQNQIVYTDELRFSNIAGQLMNDLAQNKEVELKEILEALNR